MDQLDSDFYVEIVLKVSVCGAILHDCFLFHSIFVTFHSNFCLSISAFNFFLPQKTLIFVLNKHTSQ